jgi:hypothetical protein
MNPIRPFHGRACNAWRAILLAGLTCASAALVAACGAGSAAAPPPAAPPPTVTVTAAPPLSPATPRAPSPPPTPAPTSPAYAAALPAYQPSRVVSSGGGSAYLSSPDPVGKVSGFYTQVLSEDGWQLVSRNVSSHGAELVGKRQAQEARVQIFSAGNGSTILVASYGAA